ncbi:peptidylprolyl isomerase [Chitinimonas lacunae]|uniref:Periplasmic chaperone PpiD n=1 Tax=Chitinimonas lacunae TaxID=1963018 RepID=A0ABV8MR22_9NEIS
MFDFVSKNRSVVVVALGLAGLGIVFTGSEMFANNGPSEQGLLAEVGGKKITERDLALAIGQRNVPDSVKPQVIEELVQKQLLLNEADRLNLRAVDIQLRQTILTIDAFKKDGKFDPALYKQVLSQQGKTVDQFERELRDQLRIRSVVAGSAEGNFVSKLAMERLLERMADQREVAMVAIEVEPFLAQVKVEEDEIKKFYAANAASFKQPERIKLEYVVLSREELAKAITIDDAKARKYFEDNRATLADNQEQRTARHILIKVEPQASAADKAAAKQKAEQLLAELQKDPAKFAELAKQHSQDPGSAVQGGLLPAVGRNGGFVKPFEDALFKLNKGETSAVVETQFGYHIIRLEDVQQKTFEDLKPQIVNQLQQQAITQSWNDTKDKFAELAYQQPTSIKPLADQFKLTVRQTEWVRRDGGSGDPMLDDPQLLEAIFSEEVTKKQQNSEAIEVRPGFVLVARAAAYEPAQQQALDTVRADITAKLKAQKAQELVLAEGKKQLEALRKGETLNLQWQAARPVSRLNPAGLAEKAVDAVFAVPLKEAPGYTGLANPSGSGFILYKVSKTANQPLDPAIKQGLADSMRQVLTQQEIEANLKALRERYPVLMNIKANQEKP